MWKKILSDLIWLYLHIFVNHAEKKHTAKSVLEKVIQYEFDGKRSYFASTLHDRRSTTAECRCRDDRIFTGSNIMSRICIYYIYLMMIIHNLQVQSNQMKLIQSDCKPLNVGPIFMNSWIWMCYSIIIVCIIMYIFIEYHVI